MPDRHRPGYWQERKGDRHRPGYFSERRKTHGNATKRGQWTTSMFQQRLTEQGGVCAICGGVSKALATLDRDHDHRTGQARGLLCRRCNILVGIVEGNLLGQVLAYLAKWKCVV